MKMGLLKSNKAQVFSVDIAVAIVAFITIMLIGFWVWDYSAEKMHQTERRNDLELIARNSVNVLLLTPGNPTNWTEFQQSEFNESNINSLGITLSSSVNKKDLAEKGKSAGLVNNNLIVLDKGKISKLASLNSEKYEVYKKILGILGPEYNFKLDVKPWNGTGFSSAYVVGSQQVANVKNVVKVSRFALLDGNRTQVDFFVWQKCGDVTC